jgi:hypothetical protein
MFNKCEIHPHNVLPIHTSGFRSAVSVPPKESKILKSTKLEEVTWTLPTIDISDEDFNRSGAVKQLGPLVFPVALSEWEVPLDLLDLIEEVAIKCGLPRMRYVA